MDEWSKSLLDPKKICRNSTNRYFNCSFYLAVKMVGKVKSKEPGKKRKV
jgi:hypothetical protein